MYKISQPQIYVQNNVGVTNCRICVRELSPMPKRSVLGSSSPREVRFGLGLKFFFLVKKLAYFPVNTLGHIWNYYFRWPCLRYTSNKIVERSERSVLGSSSPREVRFGLGLKFFFLVKKLAYFPVNTLGHIWPHLELLF